MFDNRHPTFFLGLALSLLNQEKGKGSSTQMTSRNWGWGAKRSLFEIGPKNPERIVKKRVSKVLGEGDGRAHVLGDKKPEIKERYKVCGKRNLI